LHEPELPEEQPSAPPAPVPQVQVSADKGIVKSRESSVIPTMSEEPAVQSGETISPSSTLPLPRLSVTPPTALGADHPPQMVTVILRPSGDLNRDIRRIGRLHGTFISFPGKDRFQFQIFEDGRGHLIDFPNETTHVCAELLEKLLQAAGEENIRIEPILFQ
jgi:hypothetical protein